MSKTIKKYQKGMDYSDSHKKNTTGKPDNAMGSHGEHQKSKKMIWGTTGKPDNAMGSHGEPWGTSNK